MTQDQKIGEIEVGLDQLERAFELLMINACGWRNGVQILRDGGVGSVKIRGGIAGMMRPIGPPPPPPRESLGCEKKPLIDEYISDVRGVLGAFFEALEGLGGGPSELGRPLP